MVRAQSVDSSACYYRTPDGRKCAIGVLMPEDAEFTTLNSMGNISSRVIQNTVCRGLGIKALDTGDISMLDSLQSIHDSTIPKHWEASLKELADRFGLTWYLDADKSVTTG